MKKILLLCFLNHLYFFSVSQKPDAFIDVLHYNFEIKLSDSSDIIKGRAGIRFKVLKPVSSVSFDFIKMTADKKGMTVTGVLDNNKPVSFVHNNDVLKINFESSLEAGAEKEIEIIYSGIPKEGLLITVNKYKHRGFFADNWPTRGRNWLPCVDHPADKATVDFIITAPLHYQVIANGIQTEETILNATDKLSHYTENTPISPKVMVIGVADFAVNYTGDVNCIPVYSWVYPEDRDKGFYDYALATEILPFYITHVGPYGYRKLANVQSKTSFGGLENANTIFYSESSVTGTRKSESLMAHEIAHQWFGNMATEADWAHLWLSEGFATYMAIQYLKNKYGTDTAKKMLIEDRKKVIAFSKEKKAPVVDSSVTDYMELLNPNSYQKGSWVLHMLQEQLGDSVFWRGISTYYNRYAGKIATTEDLQKVFEEVSGKDWKMFFRQWLYTPGQPQLNISSRYDETKKIETITITQQQPTLFQFPLELMIYGGPEDGIITKSLQVKDKQTAFSIPISEKPQKILADPNLKLLFEEVN